MRPNFINKNVRFNDVSYNAYGGHTSHSDVLMQLDNEKRTSNIESTFSVGTSDTVAVDVTISSPGSYQREIIPVDRTTSASFWAGIAAWVGTKGVPLRYNSVTGRYATPGDARLTIAGVDLIFTIPGSLGEAVRYRPATNSLYANDRFNDLLNIYSLTSGTISRYFYKASKGVQGIEIDEIGDRLFMTDTILHKLLIYKLSNPSILLAEFTTSDFPLNAPRGLRIFDGSLYIANCDAHTVLVVPLDNIVPGIYSTISGFYYPSDIIFDEIGQQMIVSNCNASTISAVPLAGGSATVVGGFNYPYGLAIYNNKLFVVNANNSTISVLALSNLTGPKTIIAVGGLAAPYGAVVDPQRKKLLVTNQWTANLYTIVYPKTYLE